MERKYFRNEKCMRIYIEFDPNGISQSNVTLCDTLQWKFSKKKTPLLHEPFGDCIKISPIFSRQIWSEDFFKFCVFLRMSKL